MQRFLLFTFLLLLTVTADAQPSKEDDKAKKPEAPAAAPLSPEESARWQELQVPIRSNNQKLQELIGLAQDGKSKDVATRAGHWLELELVFTRGQLFGRQYEDWEKTLGEKYRCEGCQVVAAPGNKTLILKPKPAAPPAPQK